MTDNLKSYRAIMKGLKQLYPHQMSGRQMQHMQVLGALISGIVRSGQSQLPAVANKMPSPTQRESRITRLRRWLKNEKITQEIYFAPFAQALINGLSHEPLVLVIDGSQLGRGCMCLMISVVYKGRALPIGWLVFRGTKGHCTEARHVELLAQVQMLIPAEATVVVLGDGEFDGVTWLQTISDYGWWYVCRTAQNALLYENGEVFKFRQWGVQAGQCLSLAQVKFTAAQYPLPLAIAWWSAQYQDPLYLVSNLELAEEACFYYRLRFRIETFFSDQKSRGFYLQRSHLADPQRLARLLIAACLAYIWMVYLGDLATHRPSWLQAIHRLKRCDLSLFQLGRALFEHFLNMDLPILVAFQMPPPTLLKCVR
jgi:hypothetical protein